MKKHFLICLIVLSNLTLEAQIFQQWNGSSNDWETEPGVSGVSIGEVGADFTPALYVRGDLMGTAGSAATGEVFETVGLHSSINAWRLKTNTGGTISEMFKIYTNTGNNHANIQAVAGELLLSSNPTSTDAIRCSTDSKQRMMIAGNGMFGVGPFFPSSWFHIQRNGSGECYSQITNTNTGHSNATDGFRFGIQTSGIAEIRQEENAELQIFTNDGTSTAKRLVIGDDGSIAIPDGVNPLYKLSVYNVSIR